MTADIVKHSRIRNVTAWCGALIAAGMLGGCATIGLRGHESRIMEVTAYCPCGKCNSYSRGSWKYLKLDVWNRHVNAGSDKGRRYTGKTANGGKLRQTNPGLLSTDSVKRPYMIPFRAACPWLTFARDGTIAADTDYYPFGTKMYVPGYGRGIVEDRGGDIKGPERIDIYFDRHSKTLKWGRQRVKVEIER